MQTEMVLIHSPILLSNIYKPTKSQKLPCASHKREKTHYSKC